MSASAREALLRTGAALLRLAADEGRAGRRRSLGAAGAGVAEGELRTALLAAIEVSGAGPPDEEIMRGSRPQLLRWHLRRERSAEDPNLYLHALLEPDAPVLHDHPWASASLALAGTTAETWTMDGGSAAFRRSLCRPGRVTLRPAALAHTLAPGRSGTAWTLFATGPKVRDWGFWPEGRFVPWQEHAGVREAPAESALTC